MDLTASAHKLVAGYSHGMRKARVVVRAHPRAEAAVPRQPFGGVDAVATSEIRELLQRLVAQRHVTVFLLARARVVERLCTHVGIIAGGKLVANGSLDRLAAKHGETSTLEQLFLSRVGGSRGDATAGLGWLTDGDAAE